METYKGGCHCQKVRFRVTADLSDVSECNCSICTKKGFLHLIVPSERFELLSGKATSPRMNSIPKWPSILSAERVAFMRSMFPDRTQTKST
jgi:hypothetical protein